MKSFLYGLLLVFLGSTISCNEANPDVYEADLIVYGGTSAGVAAAVQARRMGRSVILVGPDVHLGGSRRADSAGPTLAIPKPSGASRANFIIGSGSTTNPTTPGPGSDGKHTET